MYRKSLMQACGLLFCIALAGPALAATSSQYASNWSGSPPGGPTPGADWTPLPPNANVLGPPDSNCVGTSNAGAVWAEFTFASFGIPGGDVITGIEVNVNYRSVVTSSMQLKLSGANVGSTRTLPATPVGPSTCNDSLIRTAGGPADTWGSGLTAANFNSGNVMVRLTRTTGLDNPISLDIESVQMVVYHGNSPPNAVCKNVTKSANASCQASVAASEVNNGSTDPDGDTLSFSLSPPGPFSLGGTPVTLTVTDTSNASDTCSATITVNDNTNPVVSCPSNVSLNASPTTCQATYSGPAATAMDNCPGVGVGSSPGLPALFSGAGNKFITYTATDGSGNTSMCTQTVTVVDVTPPVITLNGPSSVTLECPAAYVEQGAAATDACAGSVPVTISGVVDTSTPGTYTVTYTASDGNGNTAMATRTVIVQDTVAPVITLNGDDPTVLECAVDSYVEPGAVVVDACDPSPSLVISGSVDEGTPGTYQIDYTATDASGNSSMETRDVVVQDTLAPEITVTSDRFVLWPPNHKYHTIDLVDVVTDASDLCDLTLSADDVVIAAVSSDEVEDAAGNGDGNTVDDIVIAADCRTVDLRAERQGGGNGRVYTLDLEATDASDNIGAASSQVEVPHGNKDTAVDDGAAYSEISDCASFKAQADCGTSPDKAGDRFQGLIEAKSQCMAADW